MCTYNRHSVCPAYRGYACIMRCALDISLVYIAPFLPNPITCRIALICRTCVSWWYAPYVHTQSVRREYSALYAVYHLYRPVLHVGIHTCNARVTRVRTSLHMCCRGATCCIT